MLDFDLRYKIPSFSDGVAWYALGYETTRDEDYEWSGIENINEDRIVCVMVGDDHEFTFDVDQLVPLKEGDYCHECGQIGCTANVY